MAEIDSETTNINLPQRQTPLSQRSWNSIDGHMQTFPPLGGAVLSSSTR